MMNKIIGYIKTHKLPVFLIIVILFLLRGVLFNITGTSGNVSTRYDTKSEGLTYSDMAAPSAAQFFGSEQYVPPVMDASDRKVVTNSNFSLLVKNVSDSIDKIRQKTETVSGYVIDVRISRGETFESANLSLRIPTADVDEMTKYLRSISVKVVSENVSGHDITDQYVDVESRLAGLYNIKSKLEQIMNSATTSDEMLRVFNQIENINSQIDSYKGRLDYMDKSSSTSKLTVALSTDELSLPYSPAQPWRPEAVFKAAVRSLLGTLQGIGTLAIWVGVYVPLLLVIVVIYVLVRKKKSPPRV